MKTGSQRLRLGVAAAVCYALWQAASQTDVSAELEQLERQQAELRVQQEMQRHPPAVDFQFVANAFRH